LEEITRQRHPELNGCEGARKARKTPSHPHCGGELMARTFDAIVVGARVNVLVAAAELARIR